MRNAISGLGRAAIAAAALAIGATGAHAADISGAGATFPYPIYAKWADAYKKETGNGLNYQSIGSGGGIKQIKAKTVTFGATDAPLTGKDLDESRSRPVPGGHGRHRAGRQSRRHQARRARDHDGPTLAKIFLGEIKTWDDPAIKKLNPNCQAAEPGDCRGASFGRFGHDLQFRLLPVRRERGLEVEGRRQHLGAMAGRHRRQGQRGRRQQRRPTPRARSATSSTPTPSRTS